MTELVSSRPFVLAALSGLLAIAGLSGCSDSPACIFAGNCNSDGGSDGGIGAFGATFPENHEWVRAGNPSLTAAFPAGIEVAVSTPLVLVFDESMAASTLEDAFELVPSSSTGGGPGGGGVALETPDVVGNGRVVVLLPQFPLSPTTSYELRRTAVSFVTDLEGSRYEAAEGDVLASFTTQSATSTTPQLIMTFPDLGALNESPNGEFVAIFDRAMDTSSISLASFGVSVDGVSPTINPLAQALEVDGAPEARVLIWNPIDPATGDVSALPLGGAVSVTLSPVGASLLSADLGVPLATEVIDYTLADFQAPTTIVLGSQSGDAIGINDLVGVTTFNVDLTFEGAQDGDVVNLLLFGADPEDSGTDIALSRNKTTGAVTFDTWTTSEIDLAPNDTPVEPLLGEGFVAFAYSVERGSQISAVRLLDVDALTTGIQDPLLDTTVPTLIGFGADGSSSTTYTSNVRDLSILGRASEELGFASVDAPGVGSTGSLATIAGSTEDGTYLTRRIAIGAPTPGLLDGPTALAGVPFTITLIDRAQNVSDPFDGTFFQVGVSGPGAALPGGPGTQVQVEVRRADTFAPVSGAQVFVHEGTDGQLVDSDQTDGSGLAALNPAANQTVLTIDAPGFGLFTWQGVPTERMSVLIEPFDAAPGLASGSVSSPDEELDELERSLGDSRRLPGSEPLISLPTCSTDLSGNTICPFNPGAVIPQRAGALGFLGVVTPASEAAYTPTGFLRAYALEMPVAGLSSGGVQSLTIELPTLPDDPDLPANELPVDGPAFTYLDTLPGSDGDPRTVVEALVYGLTGSATIGAATTFDQGAMTFQVRSAIPGIANAGGSLVTGDVIDPSLFVRVESRDSLGNIAGRRPCSAQATGTLQPPDLPTVISPPQGSTTAGASYTVIVDDVLADGVDGLYQVELTGSNGRTWTLFRDDQPGQASVSILVPDIEAAGGNPLPAGLVQAESSVFAWTGYDSSQLAFSDIRILPERFAVAVGHSFTQP